MILQKVTILNYSSFPRKRESRNFIQVQTGWIPAFAGMTTFYEFILIDLIKSDFNV